MSLFPIDGKQAHLSDLNDDLITTYKAVRSRRRQLIARLDELNEDWSEEAYYRIRSQHDLTDTVERAARFIYLNKYCYNGLSRYNSQGKFNTPWGHKKNQVALYDDDEFKAVSVAFRSAKLSTQSYDKITPAAGDYVYLDPPYHSTFNTYQKGGFGEREQEELAEFCHSLDDAGVKFMLSNSSTDFIKDLYKRYYIHTIQAPRYVSCRSDGRKPVEEVLVTNYAVERGVNTGAAS